MFSGKAPLKLTTFGNIFFLITKTLMIDPIKRHKYINSFSTTLIKEKEKIEEYNAPKTNDLFTFSDKDFKTWFASLSDSLKINSKEYLVRFWTFIFFIITNLKFLTHFNRWSDLTDKLRCTTLCKNPLKRLLH